MAIPSNPAPEFCAACGFPLRGPRCEACGVDRTPSGRRAGQAPDFDGYDGDLDAWRTRDPVRFVGYCVAAEAGTSVSPTSSVDGIGWIFALRSMTLFVGLDAPAERLAIDVPLVRVPERQRVPMMRAALELCDTASPSRLCLRDDLLLLRRVARIAVVTPTTLRQALRGSAEAGERLAGTLASWFETRPAFSEEQRVSLTWAAAGRGRPLKSFSIPPASPARPLTSGPPSQRPGAMPSVPPPPMPARLGVEPSWGAPPQTMGPKSPESTPRPVVLREVEAIPDILSPLLATPTSPSSSKPSTLPPQDPGTPPKPAAPPRPDSPSRPGSAAAPPLAPGSSPTQEPPPERRNAPVSPFRRSSPHMDAIVPPPVSGPPVSTPPVSVRPPAMPELDAEQLARHTVAPRADQARSPSERFCQLLRDAQSLATALSFQELPGVMVVLIRSTVFRAILEHGEALPSAVAHLYRSTATVTRDLGQADPSARRANPVAIAEPALLVMERIVGVRGQVPEEKPLHIDPLTSAAHAREHLARYLREIERAPAAPALRHFLALGALSELLVRAKLPAKTDQRLREIVAFAHRDGSRPAAIELMMTALNRIVAQ